MPALHDIVTKGAVDRSVVVHIMDSTDGTPETGVVFNTSGIDLWYRREGAVRTAITEAALSSTITSAAITVTGIDAAADITVSGGTYNVNGGVFTAVAGTVVNGDTVQARHTSSGSYSTPTSTIITIGGLSDTFTSTTISESGDEESEIIPARGTFQVAHA